MSVHDPMTRLYNRRKFDEFLAHEIDRAERNGHSFCVLQIDLDDFKTINDSFGHPVGDLLLKELASVLLRETRRTDVVARMGGDEFAVLLPETPREEAVGVAEKLRAALAGTRIDLPVGALRMTASLGLVSFPDNGCDAAKLIISADVAMYKAKRGGKNQVAMLGQGDDVAVSTFSKGEMVRQALVEGRLIPYFQPIIDTGSGEVAAYEVLARVVADDGSIVSAGDFIEQAEELGLGAEIDNAVFEQGLQVLASGRLGTARLFVNMSARSFADHARMLTIPDQLAALGIDPGRIVLEVTEREALPHFGEVIRLINDLRARGLAFALDDFGAGFSSFLYLKYISVDYVKIEGSFIRHMVTDERDRVMVEHIHSMARRFGMVTVAEFVEDAETLDRLREMGINHAQGFYLGQPCDMRA
jgi:diguanylate cyclase (GGDEF)-like protein